MLNAFSHFSVFLIHFVFGLYLTILLFRLILQIVYADYHNPLVQFIIKYTQPLVRPVQKIISGFKGVDFAILFLAFCFALVEFSLILLITKGTLPENFGIFILSLGVILKYLLNIMFYSVLFNAILSWIIPSVLRQNAVLSLLNQITNPFLSIFRKRIPSIKNMDFSPIFALLILEFLKILVEHSLVQFGMRLCFV